MVKPIRNNQTKSGNRQVESHAEPILQLEDWSGVQGFRLLKYGEIRYGTLNYGTITESPTRQTYWMNKQRTFQTKMAIGIIAACAVGLGCQYWDLEISRSIRSVKIPGDFRKAIGLSEAFAHSSGGVVIFGTLLWIDVKNRSKLWRAAIFAMICGIAANAAKLIVPRVRPHSLEQAEFEIVTGWQTWGVPWTGSWFEEQFRSFPSGHSATAVAIAIGLTRVYPRGKWIFASIAAVACFQRLESSAHFLSDIMGGVAITMILAIWYWKTSSRPTCGSHCESDELIQKPTKLTIE